MTEEKISLIDSLVLLWAANHIRDNYGGDVDAFLSSVESEIENSELPVSWEGISDKEDVWLRLLVDSMDSG